MVLCRQQLGSWLRGCHGPLRAITPLTSVSFARVPARDCCTSARSKLLGEHKTVTGVPLRQVAGRSEPAERPRSAKAAGRKRARPALSDSGEDERGDAGEPGDSGEGEDEEEGAFRPPAHKPGRAPLKKRAAKVLAARWLAQVQACCAPAELLASPCRPCSCSTAVHWLREHWLREAACILTGQPALRQQLCGQVEA